jgi:hypothetical protein
MSGLSGVRRSDRQETRFSELTEHLDELFTP